MILIGVENWGGGFKQNGDLDLALHKANSDSFKILMSHDPTHWEEKVIPHKRAYRFNSSWSHAWHAIWN